jgi:hypothetical protein
MMFKLSCQDWSSVFLQSKTSHNKCFDRRVKTAALFVALTLLAFGRDTALRAQTIPLMQHGSSLIGSEVSVPVHLQDSQEFSLPLDKLLAHGLLLFNANWTEQEGGGRPLTKGTGRPL